VTEVGFSAHVLEPRDARPSWRELALHSLRHGAALGHDGDGAAAAALADEIAPYR
jgi:hypothetical protein